ncbi:unnamed protein product [Orchesella dallaii]|uniref:Uncharacterized protein n=1 Tax=Orchesella dallaii TaxID=48710 RepID=A0ABP1Q9B1_9HEXA
MNMQSSITSSKKGSGESNDEAFATKMEHLTHTHKAHPIRSKTNFTPEDKSKDVLANEEINGNCEKASEDSKGGTMRLSGKLGGRTISFDDKILDSGGRSASESLSSGRSDSSKKRPMTASVQHLNKTTTFQSPNNFNPPSKVIPWTQQSTTGGKPLTLAERRAKFQRTTSIHSSSSLSLEGGDEETSEVDNSNCIRLPTNSLAYRETRKPLHVIQAPEVTTLISQINPNADEDILIEIEKVAIMLKKMQTKNFSVSLDSGIEAEMVKTSPEPNGISLKHAQNSSLMKLPASVLTTGSPCTLNESESESSITSSDDSNSSDELSQIKNKGSKSTAKVTVRGKASRATSDKLVEKSKELLSISGLKAKQCSATNCVSNSVNSANKRTSSINSTSAATNTTARRPPLRKAVSISCEQELLKTGAQRRNEVNSSANDNGKSPRPKTAAGSHQLQRCYETGTNRSTHNYNHRLTSYVSPFDNRAVTANGSSSSSQGSRNRKILIKKALMEINQSSVNLGRKWGTLGRPRTAPNLEKNTVHHGSVSKQHPSTNSQLRPKPLKA